jgi:protein SSD1
MSDPNSSAPPAPSGESKPGGPSNRGRRSAKSTGGPSTSGNGSRPHSRNANKKQQSQGQPANTQPGTGSARTNDGASSDGKGSTGRRGGAQSGRGGRGGGRKQPSTANQRPNNKDAASPAATSPGEGGSSALSNLQKAIADLKAMPNSGNQPPSAGATQPVPPTQSTLTPSAPPFHPSSFVAPAPEVPPRHRKAQSMGPTPQQQIQSYSGLGQYTPGLDSMNEDGEFQPTETVSPLAQFGRHQAMGSFTAPRFAALQGQGAQSPGEGASSGRPQLSPGFQFGTKRRTNSVSIGPPINEEDASFQFPQTPQTPQSAHKRTGSEIIAEQIAIQNQIEALQQQQQHLLAQQLATGQVRVRITIFDICSPLSTGHGYLHLRPQSQRARCSS